ncbi:hypothetical protein ACHAWF_014233 [Thalassiosira exigua]
MDVRSTFAPNLTCPVVGRPVGLPVVGLCVTGFPVGDGVGRKVGSLVGLLVGAVVGSGGFVGCAVGRAVGKRVGCAVGRDVGEVVGCEVVGPSGMSWHSSYGRYERWLAQHSFAVSWKVIHVSPWPPQGAGPSHFPTHLIERDGCTQRVKGEVDEPLADHGGRAASSPPSSAGVRRLAHLLRYGVRRDHRRGRIARLRTVDLAARELAASHVTVLVARHLPRRVGIVRKSIRMLFDGEGIRSVPTHEVAHAFRVAVALSQRPLPARTVLGAQLVDGNVLVGPRSGRALVQQSQLLDVPRTQRAALAHGLPIPQSATGDDGGLAGGGEGYRGVVHDAPEVVGTSPAVDFDGRGLLEVVEVRGVDVVPLDVDVLVAVGAGVWAKGTSDVFVVTTLQPTKPDDGAARKARATSPGCRPPFSTKKAKLTLVPESQRVQDLVHDVPQEPLVPTPPQVDVAPLSVLPPHVRQASALVIRLVVEVNVFRVVDRSGDELYHPRLVLDVGQGELDGLEGLGGEPVRGLDRVRDVKLPVASTEGGEGPQSVRVVGRPEDAVAGAGAPSPLRDGGVGVGAIVGAVDFLLLLLLLVGTVLEHEPVVPHPIRELRPEPLGDVAVARDEARVEDVRRALSVAVAPVGVGVGIQSSVSGEGELVGRLVAEDLEAEVLGLLLPAVVAVLPALAPAAVASLPLLLLLPQLSVLVVVVIVVIVVVVMVVVMMMAVAVAVTVVVVAIVTKGQVEVPRLAVVLEDRRRSPPAQVARAPAPVLVGLLPMGRREALARRRRRGRGGRAAAAAAAASSDGGGRGRRGVIVMSLGVLLGVRRYGEGAGTPGRSSSRIRRRRRKSEEVAERNGNGNARAIVERLAFCFLSRFADLMERASGGRLRCRFAGMHSYCGTRAIDSGSQTTHEMSLHTMAPSTDDLVF